MKLYLVSAATSVFKRHCDSARTIDCTPRCMLMLYKYSCIQFHLLCWELLLLHQNAVVLHDRHVQIHPSQSASLLRSYPWPDIDLPEEISCHPLSVEILHILTIVNMKLPFTNELGVSTDVSEQVSGPSTRVILHSVESSLFLGAKMKC